MTLQHYNLTLWIQIIKTLQYYKNYKINLCRDKRSNIINNTITPITIDNDYNLKLQTIVITTITRVKIPCLSPLLINPITISLSQLPIDQSYDHLPFSSPYWPIQWPSSCLSSLLINAMAVSLSQNRTRKY